MSAAVLASRYPSIRLLRGAAQAQLPKPIFDFGDGGAEDEATLRRNEDAFRRWSFLPRPLEGAGTRDQSVELFGHTLASPVIIGPTGLAGLFWPRGEIASARAAASASTVYCLSHGSACSLEDVAAAHEGLRWMQVFIYRDRGFTRELTQRARDAGYRALVLTIDNQLLGKRERDVANGFTIPPRFSGRQWMGMAAKWRWGWSMRRELRTLTFGNYVRPGSSESLATLAGRMGSLLDPAMNWDDVAALRAQWQGPLLLKGVLHPEEARRAVAAGIDGIIVSNHGGRQLDGAVSAIEALPAVVAAVEDRMPVLVDGGFRRGSDVIKAIALGARAVLIARPQLWGLAVAGEAGVAHVLSVYRSEIDRAMGLLGARSLDALRRLDVLVPHVLRALALVAMGLLGALASPLDAAAQVAPSAGERAAYTGLFAAAARGDAAEIARLAAGGAAIDARDAHGRTPLHVAAHAAQREAMRALVKAGANPNALEADRYDVVTIAAVANDVPTLKEALALGCSARNVTSRYDGTALIAAAHLGHVEVVRELIRAGAPLDHVNNLGWTALIESIVLGDGGARHTATLIALVDAGANVHIADRAGATPLALAKGRGYAEMIAVLAKAGALSLPAQAGLARMLLALALCAATASAAPEKDADYAQRLAALVNQYRASHGLRALAPDATMANLAREHSAAMAKAGRMSHDDFPSRVRRSGLAMCVENVGWNYRSPEAQFEGWRASRDHEHNMLDPRVERTGIGAVAGYVTMIACGK